MGIEDRTEAMPEEAARVVGMCSKMLVMTTPRGMLDGISARRRLMSLLSG
jgi:hypothetical protein